MTSRPSALPLVLCVLPLVLVVLWGVGVRTGAWRRVLLNWSSSGGYPQVCPKVYLDTSGGGMAPLLLLPVS